MKFLKLSLAACVAVCGIASTASAESSLEEVIKGVDVSGMIRYRYRDDRYTDRNYVTDNADRGNARHQWRAEALFKVPVTETVSLNASVRYHNPEQNVNHGNGVALDPNNSNNITPHLGKGLGSGKDSSIGVGEANLVFTPDSTSTTVKIGKMILTTPLNDPLDDRGTGILAINSDLEHWTFVGGAFDSWSIDDFQAGYVDPITGTNNGGSIAKPLYTLAALGNYATEVGNVDAQFWGFKISDILESGMFTQLGFSNSLFHVAGQYAFAVLDNEPENVLTGVYKGRVRGGADLYTLEAGMRFHDFEVPLFFKVGYMGNSKDSYAVSLDNEGAFNKAGQIWFENNATGVSISTLPIEGQSMPMLAGRESNSLSVIYANLGYDICDNLSVSIDYVMGTNELTYGGRKGDIDFQEITPTVKWQYNSNLSLSAFYAMLSTETDKADGVYPHSVAAGTTDSEDRNRLQIEVRYTF